MAITRLITGLYGGKRAGSFADKTVPPTVAPCSVTLASAWAATITASSTWDSTITITSDTDCGGSA